jgi:hypothetical protein
MAGRKKRGSGNKVDVHKANWDEILQSGKAAVAAITSAQESQVGGSHYKWMAIQPAEYAQRNGLGFLEGNVVKYVTRHDRKGGKEDLLKAIHCIQMLIEYTYGEPGNTNTDAT